MDDKHLVAVIDFGSQYTQLIVRRVRELGYMAKLYALEDLDQIHEPGAVILSGGPKSTTDADAPDIDFEWLKSLNVPVLGVCYGMQLLNIKHGGSVKASNKREYGPAALLPEACTGLYQDMSPSSQVWMSHSDTVDHLAEGCQVIARNAEGVPVSLQWGEATFGIQFHPEVTHSHEGRTILRNFLSCAANLKKFDIGDFKRQLIREIRERVGNKQVVCGVSGGVDSTVLAVLLHEAGVNMRAIFVDNGLLRKNEADEVRANFARMNVEIETVDASERFLTALAGEGDPEKKRRIIGGLFIEKSNGSPVVSGIGLVLGDAACYVLGTAWFVFQMQCDLGYALAVCVYPFIALDLGKIVVSCIVGALMRKRLIQAGVLKLA